MVWAQIFPFVALQLYEGDKADKVAITTFLVSIFSVWLVMNIIFFGTINSKYFHTFFGAKTAP